jgi:hypothetical protein
MATKVSITTSPGNRISINSQQRETIRTVGVGSATNLGSLNDVDASDADTGEVPVYDEASGKFIVKELPGINGGTF